VFFFADLKAEKPEVVYASKTVGGGIAGPRNHSAGKVRLSQLSLRQGGYRCNKHSRGERHQSSGLF
jgi:hypothetical protein